MSNVLQIKTMRRVNRITTFKPKVVAFKTGRKYSCTSICDSECVWIFEVVKRTLKSLWIKDDEGNIIRKKIKLFMDEETISPKGTYSMSPMLRASKII